jgi:alpha-glucosidase
MRRAVLFAALAYACATTPPVTSTFGVFTVTLAPDAANLSVAANGTALLDGLDASDDVGAPQSGNDDAPPMTGFAVRDVSTTTTMLGGAFEIVDSPNGPWRVARRAEWAGGAAPVALVGDDGTTLATLAFSVTDDPAHLVVDVQPGAGPERRFSWGFGCNQGDHFLGFGAQTWGADARGETIPIWTQEEGIHKDLTTDDPTGAWYIEGRRHSSYMPLPEFLSSRGFIGLADSTALSTFAMCSERSDVARMELEMPVKVHLFYGPQPKDAIGRMTGVYGRPRVPPAFAFAPWNDAIFGSANVRAVAQTLRDHGIPSSVIWTEDWRGGEWATDVPNHYALKEEWDVDRTLYPDFEQVAADLHADGFKWLVYFNSFVEKDSKAWPETAPNGYLIENASGQPYTFLDAKLTDASLLDLSNPDAVKWAVGKMQTAIAEGADGWMGDFSEWLPTDATLYGGSGKDLHALYPIMWQEAQRQAMDTVGDGVERLSFVRSGWLGSPPLVDVYWPGDQQTDFGVDDGMPTVVPVALGLSISGISTFGSDIAGYQNLDSQASTKELFFRWTELGAFSPVMRTHHGSFPNLNWAFDEDDETLLHWKRYAMLHVALAPYLRSLAQSAHDTGVAIMRPLAVEFPDDAAAWPIADEYMLGPSLLVAPVTAAGATSRTVHLPPGSWFPWAGGAAVGGGDPTADAPLSEIPVYARAGAIVPAYPDGVMTLVTEPGPDRVVYAFAGADGSFTEVDGVGYALTSTGTASGAVTVTWDGTPLAACGPTPAAPCAASDAGVVRAYVTGPGTLELQGVATFAVTGADAAAAEEIVVRY